MRLRKQSKPTALPGDEFLRAVSSGREHPPAPVIPDHTDESSSLEQRVLESERRAAAADEALRRIRAESDERLEQARRALARERRARLDAEQELMRRREAHDPTAGAPESAPEEDASGTDPDPEAAAPTAAEQPVPDLTFGDRAEDPPDASEVDPPADSDEAGWPTPWLDEAPRKRGLFRRSRS